MEIPAGENPLAQAIAQTLLDGFNKHYRLFSESSAQAKPRFESGDWLGVQRAVRERIAFYDERVNENVSRLRQQFQAENIDDNTWQLAKLLYIGLLTNHKQPELAETFFNSVFCKIMHRTYFQNDFIFVRPAVSTEFIESDPPAYRSYYPNKTGLRQAVRDICGDFARERRLQICSQAKRIEGEELTAEIKVFKAVADVTRLKILKLLSGGELCICEIMLAL